MESVADAAAADAGAVLTVGVVGLRSQTFRRVYLSEADRTGLKVTEPGPSFRGDAHLLRLAVQAYVLGIAFEFDPYFGLSVSRVDPLPHQLEAVYDYLLKSPRVRFLLADDAGAGKTIMAGLLIRELKLRGLVERVLIVCPANLAFQWQRELKEKFDEKFTVLKGDLIREQFGANQWQENPRAITSLDLAKREEILPGLRQTRWDLVIVDEAHRMSWTPPSRKTARYALGELLRDSSDHLLLLTATPHKGDPENFNLFLQLLDADAYADPDSIRKAMENRVAPFYLRRTKEAMSHFPQRQPDGTWRRLKLFTKRLPHVADFHIEGAEDQLYCDVTRFVKSESHRAALEGDDPRAHAIRFLMALYQRRLASSTYALRRSLENRAKRLAEGLRQAQDLARTAPPDLPSTEEIEEMEDADRERLERLLDAVTLSQNPELTRQEVGALDALAGQARAVEQSGSEAKLTKLRQVLDEEGYFGSPERRLLIFTEFRDTLDYLVERLRAWGFRVGSIHGGMAIGTRDAPGTRLFAEQQFKDGAVQILVATEAAGEGINLQCCNVLFNYDIPWNPNRLEQRMGRIHRYGQTKDCLIFNFVATNTIEGRVLGRLLEKLQEIRDALDDDAVFNVVGEVLPAGRIEAVLRDYYAGDMGDADLEERLMRDVDEGRFRAICQNALEGLATRSLNLEMLTERRARAQERRLVPETIARFLAHAAPLADFQLRPATGLAHTFEPGPTPPALRRYESQPDWRLPALAQRYPRFSTDRATAESANLEWVTPGHPLFEALRRHALACGQDALAQGACFYSLADDRPFRLDLYRARVADGMGQTAHERLFAVAVTENGHAELADPARLGDLQPAEIPRGAGVPAAATAPSAEAWLYARAFEPFLGEVRAERKTEVERVAAHVETSLRALLQREDNLIGRFGHEVEQGVEGAAGRLAQAESRHAELMHRLGRRRQELERQAALSLQAVERLASALVLPHPDRDQPDLRNLRSNPVTEAVAMRVARAHEEAAHRTVEDVHEKNLGYDLTSLDPGSGELRLIEVKGIGASTGAIGLTPNEMRVAQDRRDCYWLYIVTQCSSPEPVLLEPIRDPGRLGWQEINKIEHYTLTLSAIERQAGGGA